MTNLSQPGSKCLHLWGCTRASAPLARIQTCCGKDTQRPRHRTPRLTAGCTAIQEEVRFQKVELLIGETQKRRRQSCCTGWLAALHSNECEDSYEMFVALLLPPAPRLGSASVLSSLSFLASAPRVDSRTVIGTGRETSDAWKWKQTMQTVDIENLPVRAFGPERIRCPRADAADAGALLAAGAGSSAGIDRDRGTVTGTSSAFAARVCASRAGKPAGAAASRLRCGGPVPQRGVAWRQRLL